MNRIAIISMCSILIMMVSDSRCQSQIDAQYGLALPGELASYTLNQSRFGSIISYQELIHPTWQSIDVSDTGNQIQLSDLKLGSDKCAGYKRMRKAGTVFVFVGSGIVLGGTLLFVGSKIDGESDEALSKAGRILASVGGVVLAIGIPLKIVGSVKSRQYCVDDANSMLELNLTPNGLAMNYQF